MIFVIQSRKFNKEHILDPKNSLFTDNFRKLNLKINLKKAELIQSSMSESGKNIFVHHIGDIKGDICNTIKKIHVWY